MRASAVPPVLRWQGVGACRSLLPWTVPHIRSAASLVAAEKRACAQQHGPARSGEDVVTGGSRRAHKLGWLWVGPPVKVFALSWRRGSGGERHYVCSPLAKKE
jgi:hypothetical protein